MKSISPIRLCVALIALIFTQQAYCAGSSVANKSVKIFKELIVEGEFIAKLIGNLKCPSAPSSRNIW